MTRCRPGIVTHAESRAIPDQRCNTARQWRSVLHRIRETKILMPLEILHLALVALGRGAGIESAEIAALAGLRVCLARVEPVFAGGELADHGGFSR